MNSDHSKTLPPVPERPSATRRLFFYWLPVVLYCGLIAWQSSLPTSKDPFLFHHEDKLMHMGACAVLAWLFVRALAGTLPQLSPKTLGWATLAFVFLFGLSDEVHQLFVPTRTASFGDLAADFCGGLVGIWLFLDILRPRK